ncbi:MAG: type I 3-dehydroquinate dehydratase, partial [Candidatus Bathyarchaeia archaeon]
MNHSLKPKICVPIPCRGVDEARYLIDEACKVEADLMELRLDYLDDIGKFKDVINYAVNSGIPVIATVRARSHGGFWKWGEKSRISV